MYLIISYVLGRLNQIRQCTYIQRVYNLWGRYIVNQVLYCNVLNIILKVGGTEQGLYILNSIVFSINVYSIYYIVYYILTSI